MEDIIVESGIGDAVSMPFMMIRQFDSTSLPFTDQDSSFWSNPKLSMENGPVIRARIFRVYKEIGIMNVIGIDADVNMDVPITQSFAGTEFHGDVSLPAPGWEVILLRSANGDYYPIRYKRPYSEKNGWSHSIPDDIESGDWGVTSSGGGKIMMFDSGLIQMESSPSCLRSMSPLEDDERIEDLCRRYGLHSDAGKIIASEHDNSPLFASRIEIQANESMASETNPVSVFKMGSFDLSGVNSGARLEIFEPKSKQKMGSFEINKIGTASLNAEVSVTIGSKRVALGSDSATEPIVLGNQLLARITDIESKISLLQAAIVAHTHTFPASGGPPTSNGIPVSPLSPPASSPNFLSTTSFSI